MMFNIFPNHANTIARERRDIQTNERRFNQIHLYRDLTATTGTQCQTRYDQFMSIMKHFSWIHPLQRKHTDGLPDEANHGL